MSTEPQWTVSTYPRNIIRKGEPMGNGKIATQDQADDSRKKAIYEHRLCYEGKTVHVLTGDHGKEALDAMAIEFNGEKYVPKLDSQRLYFELTQAQKEKLAALTSPELPFNYAPA